MSSLPGRVSAGVGGHTASWRLGEGSFLAVGGSGNLGTELSGPGWARGTLTAAWH